MPTKITTNKTSTQNSHHSKQTTSKTLQNNHHKIGGSLFSHPSLPILKFSLDFSIDSSWFYPHLAFHEKATEQYRCSSLNHSISFQNFKSISYPGINHKTNQCLQPVDFPLQIYSLVSLSFTISYSLISNSPNS